MNTYYSWISFCIRDYVFICEQCQCTKQIPCKQYAQNDRVRQATMFFNRHFVTVISIISAVINFIFTIRLDFENFKNCQKSK